MHPRLLNGCSRRVPSNTATVSSLKATAVLAYRTVRCLAAADSPNGSGESTTAVSPPAASAPGVQPSSGQPVPLAAAHIQNAQQQPPQHATSAANGAPRVVLHQYRQQHPQPTLQHAPMQQFELESETPVHQRYLTVYNRKVRFSAPERPSESHSLEFDVVGHPRANFCFSVTFPFHPYKDGRPGGEVTLIREYAQGPNALMYCLPTGALDPKRHADLEECAARELSEEAWLAGGEWHRLLPADHAGLPEVKWCMNRFVPFLAIDPQPDPNPGSRDAEEASMEVLRVPLEQFKELMVSGEMLLPSITTAYLALDKLKERGLL